MNSARSSDENCDTSNDQSHLVWPRSVRISSRSVNSRNVRSRDLMYLTSFEAQTLGAF